MRTICLSTMLLIPLMGAKAQQLNLAAPVHTEGVTISLFDADLRLSPGAEMPGSGSWRFLGTTLLRVINETGSTASFPSLQMRNASGAALEGGAVAVRDNMQFGIGVFNTGTHRLIFGPDATVGGARNFSHVEGTVAKEGNSDFVFPLGEAGAYQPVTLFDFDGENSIFEAGYRASGHPDPEGPWFDGNNWPVSTCDYWSVLRTAGNAEARLRLGWAESACSEVNDIDYIRVARYRDGAWSLLGTEVMDPSTQSIETATRESNFGDFALASIGGGINVLPIELLFFDATLLSSGSVICEWMPASETNNAFFTVERSLDGQSWEKLQALKGAGFSQSALSYSWIDAAPYSGYAYYRLRQTDFDGTSTVSAPQVVYKPYAASQLELQKAYRNGSQLALYFRAVPGEVHVEIFDLFGKIVHSVSLRGEEGMGRLRPTLAGGMYIVQLRQNGRASAAKVLW